MNRWLRFLLKLWSSFLIARCLGKKLVSGDLALRDTTKNFCFVWGHRRERGCKVAYATDGILISKQSRWSMTDYISFMAIIPSLLNRWLFQVG